MVLPVTLQQLDVPSFSFEATPAPTINVHPLIFRKYDLIVLKYRILTANSKNATAIKCVERGNLVRLCTVLTGAFARYMYWKMVQIAARTSIIE